jgi:hypothetical protein
MGRFGGYAPDRSSIQDCHITSPTKTHEVEREPNFEGLYLDNQTDKNCGTYCVG